MNRLALYSLFLLCGMSHIYARIVQVQNASTFPIVIASGFYAAADHTKLILPHGSNISKNDIGIYILPQGNSMDIVAPDTLEHDTTCDIWYSYDLGDLIYVIDHEDRMQKAGIYYDDLGLSIETLYFGNRPDGTLFSVHNILGFLVAAHETFDTAWERARKLSGDNHPSTMTFGSLRVQAAYQALSTWFQSMFIK